MKLALKSATPSLVLLLAVVATHASPPPEKVTWLGVTSRETPPVIAAQLDLPKQTGLVVDLVVPDSPAAKAGVQTHDVLTKFDDQILINSPQLAVLVRNKKAGEKVQLTLLRKGKSQTLSVSLGEKEATPECELGEITIQPGVVPPGLMPLPPGQGVPGNGWWTPPGASVMIQSAGGDENGSLSVSQFSDGQHNITVETRNGTRTANISDKNGKVLFNGPIDTDEQKAKLPAELADKLKRMLAQEQQVPPQLLAPPPPAPDPM